MSSPWLWRGILIAVFLGVAWQSLVAHSAETAAWARANELRSSAGCADYLAWAKGALEPPSRGPLTLFRAVVTPWITPVEAHQRVATKCPASVSDQWSR